MLSGILKCNTIHDRHATSLSAINRNKKQLYLHLPHNNTNRTIGKGKIFEHVKHLKYPSNAVFVKKRRNI